MTKPKENTSKPEEKGKENQPEQVDRPINDTVQVEGTSFHILTKQPCPEYANIGTKAFKVRDSNTGEELIALLTGNVAIPRFSYMPSLRNMRSSRIVSFHGSGIVKIPDDNKNYVACIFDVPHGAKVMNDQSGDVLHFMPSDYSQKFLNSQIIEPVLKLLQDLRRLDIKHGAINLNNIYVVEEKEGLQIQLGECITSPHSYTQNAIFEPINRATAQPTARGICSEKDDLYSFGICLALMLIGSNPFKGLTEKQVITRKIEVGTYMSIAKNNRLPSGISEFLRGVLNDEYSSRWSLDEAIKWVEGSRMTIRTPRPAYKAARPYVFMDKNYSYVSTLVNAFAENPSYAVQALKEKKFREWLHRNITDKGTLVNFDKSFGPDKNLVEAYENHDDLMLAHACIALDSMAPIRYRNLSITPRGFGMGLAHAVMHKEDINSYIDILRKQIFHYWFDMQHVHFADASGLALELEKARNFMRQKMIARGFERVLYILCLETHCLSPTIKDLYVRDSADLLDAFELLAKNNTLPSLDNFFDRHIIAFLMERESQVIEPQLSMIVSSSKEHRIIGLLRVFTTIQKIFGGRPAPHLCKWFVANIEPALSRIHDRKRRKALLEKTRSLSNETQFSVLLTMVDNVDIVRDDMHKFLLAQSEYKTLNTERKKLQYKLKKGALLGLSSGRQVAMVVSVLLSMISILIMVLKYLNII